MFLSLIFQDLTGWFARYRIKISFHKSGGKRDPALIRVRVKGDDIDLVAVLLVGMKHNKRLQEAVLNASAQWQDPETQKTLDTT